jgi:hypothetical protein
MRKSIARFIRDESGATAIEYGLISGHRGRNNRHCAGTRNELEHHVQHRFHRDQITADHPHVLTWDPGSDAGVSVTSRLYRKPGCYVRCRLVPAEYVTGQ